MTARTTAAPPSASATTATTRSWRPFILVAVIVMLALATSSTPSPLYSVYQGEWGFDAFSLTKVFSVYAVAVLFTLIVAGGLSDLVGRRPVIWTSLVGLLVAIGIFMFAQNIAWLYTGRIVQGLAMGLLLGASGAALIDLHPAATPGTPAWSAA